MLPGMMMSGLDAKLLKALGMLGSGQALLIAGVLGVLAGRGLRAALLLATDRGRGPLVVMARLVGAALFATLAIGYFALTAAMTRWEFGTIAVAALAVGAMCSGIVIGRIFRTRQRASLVGGLVRTTLLLLLMLVAALTLMRSGFLALTTDRPVLLIELTGETRQQTVRWAAPDEPLKEQALRTHRVLLRSPESGEPIVAEAWLYGDQVAVQGRVLRLPPLLTVAGIPNLFELLFVHNGYFTAERHSLQPHQAQVLQLGGPLAVHRYWQRPRDWLWERSSAGASGDGKGVNWGMVAATTESTYFPLVDPQGQPVRHTYELVLTPGGLTSR